MNDQTIGITVNGRRIETVVPARRTLADFLRDDLHLTGTHLGCEHGVCGACTVLIDGHSARACITLAAQASGSDVTTVEGLEDDELAARLRSAMSRHHGLQCGFCTAGFMTSATELLEDRDRSKPLEPQQVRERLSGNLCRCTGYQGIIRAVLEVGNDLDLEGTDEQGEDPS